MKVELDLEDGDVLIVSKPKEFPKSSMVIGGKLIKLYRGIILEKIIDQLKTEERYKDLESSPRFFSE